MKRLLAIFLPVVAAFIFSATAGYGAESLTGAGATFPYPLYDKWFSIYHQVTGVKVNYQAIGSGGGIRQLLSRVVDFGGTDAFMSDEELSKAPGEILHIPTCLGAVAITYNIPGNPELKLTGDVIADIFLGKITRWNDSRITELNPGIELPDMKIIVVHRSDGSGTTFIFSDYLSKVSPEWKEKVGRGKSLNWPAGLGAKGNAGVAGMVKQMAGSIGYVELIYAEQNKMPVALVKNRAGNFIKPSLASVSAAANVELPPDTRVSITDTESPEGYPISSFTWIIFYKEQSYDNRSRERAEALAKLLWWMIHEGQKYNESLLYAKLPPKAVEKAEAIIKTMTYNGAPLVNW
ncbi:phosphate ABC transporter substrate-binding protein PstS [Thermodesulforhabdus norvegica]|uniref:Phosphate-binding protein n=1 Tax=Thermodesulforhabdus norvegica TaxID=39841 RepID=A0A1I4VX34_9BACT|nr:phosphate ABC transporter substrate-binding protein PstS [Thermodesulforhabdus norvegica]SFN05556.1 phosphate ABC transporter substrate-binding protein, PhoT family (TC 3.A.1.7.1) [Thermodesulforhabdus norvegica]